MLRRIRARREPDHFTDAPEKRIFDRPVGLVMIVLYKTLAGIFEIIIGTFFIFARPLISGELAEDPSDHLINWIFTHTTLTVDAAATAGTIILALGFIELILATGIWQRSWRFRRAALGFFCAIAVFGSYDLLVAFSFLKVLAVIADIAIVVYLWKVLPIHLRPVNVSATG